MIKPTGSFVLVEATLVEKVTQGGIVLPTDLTTKEQVIERTGKVVAIGPCAYVGWAGCDQPDKTPYQCWGIEIGDTIEHKKYDGLDSVTSNDVIYRYIQDTDILGVLNER